MINAEELSRFLFELERGSFWRCYNLRRAYERMETMEYLMGTWYPTAEKVEKICTEVVEAIKWKLEYWERSGIKEVDHYWRYLHGLTILGIDKSLISKSATNVKQQVAYELWQLDDGGGYYTENILNKVAWCFAEVAKNREDMMGWGLESGSRHKKGRKRRVHKSLIKNESLIKVGINLKDKEVVESYVNIICEKLENEMMSLREYTQYLHVLTLLGVPKYSEKVPAINTQKAMYDIAYELWGLDTSEQNWNIIEEISNLGSKLK